jgi:hypothetical protein
MEQKRLIVKGKERNPGISIGVSIIFIVFGIFVVASLTTIVVVFLYLYGTTTTTTTTTLSELFNVTGDLPSNSSRRRGLSNVDYLYVVNAAPLSHASDSLHTQLIPVNESGSFEVQLIKNFPWIFIFIDSSKTGSDMIQYIFKAEELCAIYGTKNTNDTVNLGTLILNGTNMKLNTELYQGYLGDLDLDNNEASILSMLDKTTLRYSNPDVEGDTNIDIEQTDLPNMQIWLWLHYLYGNLSTNYLTNYIKQELEIPYTNIDMNFVYTGPELMINNIIGNEHVKDLYRTAPEKWILRWTDSGDLTIDYAEYNQSFSGDSGGENTYGYQTMIFDYLNTTWEHLSLKITFNRSIDNPPEGTYTYEIYEYENNTTPNETLTFVYVNNPEDTKATNYHIFPFPRPFNLDANNKIEGFDYIWKIYNESSQSFTTATSKEIEIRIGRNPAQIKWCNNITIESETPTNLGCDELSFTPYNLDFETSGTVTREITSSFEKILLSELVQVQLSYTTIGGITFKVMIENTDGDTHGFFP